MPRLSQREHNGCHSCREAAREHHVNADEDLGQAEPSLCDSHSDLRDLDRQ